MDYESYRQAYFVDPPPVARYAMAGIFGVAIFVRPYGEALAYYRRVLGEPAYVEGEWTHGWQIGERWLTVFPAKEGNPSNVEITLLVDSPEEADRLQRAFIDQGGTGQKPVDELMYEPLRICAVTDPFGTEYLIVARLSKD